MAERDLLVGAFGFKEFRQVIRSEKFRCLSLDIGLEVLSLVVTLDEALENS